jgi:hypothetical protein
MLKLGLVGSPVCDKCKQAPSTASHVLGNCVVLAKLKSQHLGRDLMQPGDFTDIFVSKVLHFVQSLGLLNA